ncbi:MAG: glycosyltransferase, partial [Anaerolineae bacterium]
LNRTKCPVKLLDLLSAGIPVVGDAVGQIGEVIVEGKTGRLVAPDDDLAFAEAVLELLVEPQRLRPMGAAAKKDVHRRYSWDRLAEVAETAYRYAIAHGTG